MNYAGFGMITDLRDDLYNAILRRSVSFFQQHATGTIVSTLINDIERVQFAMSSVLAEFLQQFFTLIFTACVVVGLGRQAGLGPAALCPGGVGLGAQDRPSGAADHAPRPGQAGGDPEHSARDHHRQSHRQGFQHGAVGDDAVQTGGPPPLPKPTCVRCARRPSVRRSWIRSARWRSPCCCWLAAISIQRPRLTAGTFFAFIIAVFKLYDPVRKFALFYNNFQQALGASSEIFRFMDTQDEVREKAGAHVLKEFQQEIRFEHVCFDYRNEEGERQVLRDINLVVPRGEVVALVGPSGAGKSTLVNLIPRFFDVTAGSIRIDGHDLRDLSLSSLRSHIGNVTQETILFNDTVRNNIAYGEAGIPLSRVIDIRPRGAGPRLYRAASRKVQYRDRRKGFSPLRRRAPAYRHCPRIAQERAHPHSGRSYLRA